MLCSSAVMAEMHMTSSVSCDGDCSVKQIYNGKSVSVTSSHVDMTTEGNGKQATVTVNSEGPGQATVNLSDSKDSGLIIGSSQFEGINDSEENESEVLDENESVQNSSLEKASVNYTYESPTNKTIEVVVDGSQETVQTEGVFQKVYNFLQSFTAKIFWS